MIVEWKEDRLKIVPLIPNEKLAKGFIPHDSQRAIYPGVNEIDDEEWALIQPHVQDRIATGHLVVKGGVKVPAGQGKTKVAVNLVDFPANTAKAMIKDCSSPATLQRWEQEETRPDLRLLIQKQMDKLKVEPVEGDIVSDDETLVTPQDDKTE